MRIDQTAGHERAPRVGIDRVATLRDPARQPIDVVIADLSETGALLKGEGALPVGTLVSLGIAGIGMRLARVVRSRPEDMGIEFMLPIDPVAVMRARTADTLVSVAFPQITPGSSLALLLPEVTRTSRSATDQTVDPRSLASAAPASLPAPGLRPGTIWMICGAVALLLLILVAR